MVVGGIAILTLFFFLSGESSNSPGGSSFDGGGNSEMGNVADLDGIEMPNMEALKMPDGPKGPGKTSKISNEMPDIEALMGGMDMPDVEAMEGMDMPDMEEAIAEAEAEMAEATAEAEAEMAEATAEVEAAEEAAAAAPAAEEAAAAAPEAEAAPAPEAEAPPAAAPEAEAPPAAAPAPEAKKTGKVKVSSKPSPNARIYVDGADKGAAPLTLTLDEGSHQVKVVSKSGKEKTFKVDVKASGTKSLCWNFKKSKNCGR